jgi:DNA polymerase-4
MDAFFVNVYLLAHPDDAGIPLAVGGRPESRGVVTSASYEARAFGVRSAMPMKQAVALCPELKIVGVDRQAVGAFSRQVMGILGEYGPLEQISVDEAYIDLSEHRAPVRLCDTIRQRVRAETGLPASVGLATSKLVAKVASDRDKPDGRTIVLPGQEATFLGPLSVRVISGIGPVTTDRLARLGIETCEELAAADVDMLEKQFGQHAAALIARARGEDRRPVVADRGPAKSISAENTFERDQRDAAVLLAELARLVARVGRSLRREGLEAHTVTVKFRWPDFTTFTRQRTVSAGIREDGEILALAQMIWDENWPPGQPVRLLGVGVGKLTAPEGRQLAFDFPPEDQDAGS